MSNQKVLPVMMKNTSLRTKHAGPKGVYEFPEVFPCCSLKSPMGATDSSHGFKPWKNVIIKTQVPLGTADKTMCVVPLGLLNYIEHFN